jgi:hypothetical protein
MNIRQTPLGDLMKIKMLPLLVLMALPAMAQERWQVGLGINGWESSREDDQGSNSLYNLKRDARIIPGLQAGYSFKPFSGSDLSVRPQPGHPAGRFGQTAADAVHGR